MVPFFVSNSYCIIKTARHVLESVDHSIKKILKNFPETFKRGHLCQLIHLISVVSFIPLYHCLNLQQKFTNLLSVSQISVIEHMITLTALNGSSDNFIFISFWLYCLLVTFIPVCEEDNNILQHIFTKNLFNVCQSDFVLLCEPAEWTPGAARNTLLANSLESCSFGRLVQKNPGVSMTDTDLPSITDLWMLDIFVTAYRLLPRVNLSSPSMVFPEELFPTPFFPRRTILMLPLCCRGAFTFQKEEREKKYV